MAYPIVHFEIAGEDGAALQAFYRDLFEWEIDADNPMNYGYVRFPEGPLTGGITPTHGNFKNLLTIFVGVPDVAAHLQKAESLGGKTLLPPTEIPGGGTFAHFADPAGNRVGLFKP